MYKLLRGVAQLVEHSFIFRGVAQLVEHHVRDVGAAGSNPVTPTLLTSPENVKAFSGESFIGTWQMNKKTPPTKAEVKKRIKNVLADFEELFDTVILFGSFARGEQKKDSDIDLFILSETTTNKLLTSKAYNDFHDRLYASFDNSIPFDLLVYGGKRDVHRVLDSSFYSHVKQDGVVLYDKRTNAV